MHTLHILSRCFVTFVLACIVVDFDCCAFLPSGDEAVLQFSKEWTRFGVGDNVVSKETGVMRLLCPFVCRAPRA